VGLEVLRAFAQLAYLSLPSLLIRILVFFDLSLLWMPKWILKDRLFEVLRNPVEIQ